MNMFKNLGQTAVGVLVGGLLLGGFLNLAGRGKLGKQLQSVAQYVNEGFAVDL